MIEGISEKQVALLNLLGAEVGAEAWEFFVCLNPIRQPDERKIMRRVGQVRTELAAEHLKDLRRMNARRQDVYLRPSHSSDSRGAVPDGSCIMYPYFVLDDVRPEVAREIGKRHRCVSISTSQEGGCQLWVVCNRAISVNTRHKIQSHFAQKGICDKGATSGSQYFRFPHFKNHKRSGQWANLMHVPRKGDPPFDVDMFLESIGNLSAPEYRPATPVGGWRPKPPRPPVLNERKEGHQSPSEHDWHEVVNRMRSGEDAEDIIADLEPRSVARGKHHSYARRTVQKVERWLLSYQ